MSRELRPHQIKAIDGLRSSLKAGFRRPLLFLPTGAGKCLGLGTPVLMHDGSVKNVEDVVAGDVLMGPLSEPKTVLSTCLGEGELFRIVPTKGEPWVCNDVHVLTLVETQTGEVIDIPLDEYLTRSKTFKHVYKQFSPPGGIDFPASEAGDPNVPGYFLGVWAGDGTKRLGTIHVHKPDQEIEDCCREVAGQFGCQMTRREQRTCPEYSITTARGQPNPLLRAMRLLVGRDFIHQSILVASRDYRLQFLAGILDTDGHLTKGCFEIVQKSRVYADAIVFLARSLGFKACLKAKIVNDVTYWRVGINGNIHIIPTRIPRKRAPTRRQIKVATRTGFKVEAIGRGEYAGFELDGDGRFLLGDFTVTHNTRCAGEIVKGARAKGKRVLFVVPAISLIDQTVRSFWAEGITDIGVIQGQHPMTRPEAPVQVASIQTLQRRAIPPFDVVVIDEAHVLFDMLGKWMAAETWQRVPFIGLSATPWTRGLGKHYDDLIQVTTTAELIEAGYLSPFRVYAPSHPDLGGVRTVAGDYHEGDLGEAMNKPALVADVVTTWRQRGENRPTFVFAVDRAHAKHLQGEFEKAGINCGYIDAYTTPDEREAMFKRFSAGELRVIASVGCLTTGVDLDVRCIVLARPTRSEMLYCLHERTEILTREGFKSLGEIKVGDIVAAPNKETLDIEWKPVQAVVDRDIGEGEFMVEYNSPHLAFSVTDQHRMLFSGRPRSAFQRQIRVATAESLLTRQSEFSIPVSGTMEFPGVALTDDELSFLGWVMTDGSINRANRAITIYQSQRHQEYLAEIRRVLIGCGFKFYEFTGPCASNFEGKFQPRLRFIVSHGQPRAKDKHLRGWSALEPYIAKDMALTLMDMTARQFEVMLEAIHLGDGNKQRGQSWTQRSYHIASGNKTFIDRLQMMAVLRGWMCNVTSRANNNGNPIHTAHLKRQSKRCIGGSSALDRPTLTENRAYRGRVWCVQNENGALVTRHDGKVMLTGNCQIVGRGLRTASDHPVYGPKVDLLLLDHSDTTLRLGFVTDIHHDVLDDGRERQKAEPRQKPEALPKECSACNFLKPAKTPKCPACGFKPERQSEIVCEDGQLVEMTPRRKKAKADEKAFVFGQLKAYGRSKGHKPGWAANQFKERYGVWPARGMNAPETEPTAETLGWIKSREIAFARRKEPTYAAAAE